MSHYLTLINHPRYAQAFVDHLNAKGIVARLERKSDGMALYLRDADALPQAQEELSRFLDNPNHERYLAASWVSGDTEDTLSLSHFYRDSSLGKAVRQTGKITAVVMLLCTILFVFTGQGYNDLTLMPLLFFSSTVDMMDLSQAWRWFSPSFLHYGVFHFLFNLGAWWIFGGMIERLQSGSRLFMVLLLSSFASNTIQFLFTGNNFVGLSGVVYGIFGYLWLYIKLTPNAPFRIPPAMFIFILVTLALGFLDFLPVANHAHLSGLIMGAVLGTAYGVLDRF